MQKKPYEVHYSVLLWYTWARYVRIVQAQGRTLVVENYSTDVKMFKNINYNARGESTVQTQSRTVRYYCCEYLQEIYTDRTACMPQNLQASQHSWCKNQDFMQTRCSHDVRATGRHLRFGIMTHRDAFPISHNFYRLRYIMVSIRAHTHPHKKMNHRGLLYTTLLALAAFATCRHSRQHRLLYSTYTDVHV